MSDPTLAVPSAVFIVLAAPFAGLVAAGGLSACAPRTQQRSFLALPIGIALVLLCAYYDLRTAIYEINLLLVLLAYLAFCVLAISLFRIRPRWVGIPLGLVAVSSQIWGFFNLGLALLVLSFSIGMDTPIHREAKAVEPVCYVMRYGSAMTQGSGLTVHLRRTVPVLSFLEYTVHRQGFAEAEFGPAEACRRARKDYASLLTPVR